MSVVRVFIGYDSTEPVSYHVLSHSILRRASVPVSITPLARTQLQGLYTRERGPTESTEFSLSRFLTPWLAGEFGFAIFLDSDMLCLGDIADLVRAAKRNLGAAVSVCQHDYTPATGTKFLGHVQTIYPRKNWSSVMVFDCSHIRCKGLTPEYVNAAPALDLHRLVWARDRVGALPLAWNHLIGEYAPNADAKLLHYTLGGPWFHETADCPQADLWWAEYDAMLAPLKRP